MFNKLKDNVTKTKDALKVTGDRNHPTRSRTSSTGSKCSQVSTTAMNSDRTSDADPSAGPAMLEWTNDSIQGDSDSASVISSVCPSTAEASVFQARYQKLHRLARGYKEKYQQAMDKFKKVTQERDHLRELLATQQTQAFRRIDELREELALDKKAKQDVDVNYNLMLSEKDQFIQVLRLQVSLLKEGKDLPPELEAKISAGHAREVQRQRSLEQENEDLKTEVRTLTTQLQLTTTQLEEQIVQRSQLEEALNAHQVQLQQFQAQIEEFGPLKRELTDSKLAQSALEEQVRGLKTQLSSLMAPAAIMACETEIPQQAEPLQASTDLKEPNDAIKLLELQVADLSKALEETRAHLTSSEALQTRLRSELDDYKKQEPNNQELREQYEHAVGRLSEMERLLSEKTDEFISSTRALEAMNIREQDLVVKLDDARARLVDMKSQLDTSTLKLAELEHKETVWKTTEEDYETLKREHSVVVDSNRQLQSHLISKLQGSGLLLDYKETSSLEGLVEQLLEFVSTATHRLDETHTEQLRILTEQHAADVSSLKDSLNTERSLREELQTKIDETEKHLADIQLKLSEAKSMLSLREEEIHSLTKKLQEAIECNTQLQARFSNTERETEDLIALRQATEVLCKERDELLAKLSTAECERRTEYATLVSQTEEVSSALAAANRRLQVSQAAVKQCSDMAAEVTSLRQQLTTAHSCLQALRSDLKFYEAESMNAVSGIVLQSIDEVEVSCLELMGKIFEERTNTNQKLQSLQARLLATEDELVHWKRKCSCLEDSLNSQTTVITEFRSSIHEQSDTNVASSMQSLQTRLDELTSLYQSNNALLSSKDAQISELKEELSTLRNTSSLQLQESVVQTEQMKTQLQKEVSDWDLRSKQAYEQINTQHDRLFSLVNLVNASFERLAKAEHQLELVRQHQQHQSMNTSLQEELNRMRTDLTEVETEKSQLLDELNHTKQQFDALQTQFKDTVQRMDSNATAHATVVLRSRLERLKASSSSIDQVLSDDLSFTTRLTSVEKCFQDLVAQLSLTNQPVWSCDALAYEPIEHQLDELEQAFDQYILRLDEQKHSADEEVQRLSLELASVQEHLHQTTDSLNNAEGNTSLCMERIQKLENELLSEQEQKEGIRIKLTEVQLSLETVRKDREESVAAIQQQLDNAIQELATARSSLLERESELSNLAAGTESLKHQLSDVKRTYTEILKQTINSQSHCLRTRTDRAREWLTRNCGKLDLNGPDSLTTHFESIDQLVVESDTLDFTEPSLVCAFLERFAQAEQWLVDLSSKANQLQSSRQEELAELETLRASERQLVDKCAVLEQRGLELQTELENFAQTHSKLADLQKEIAEKNDFVIFMKSELDEFKKTQDVLNSKLASKQTEADQLTTDVSTWKMQFSKLQQQLDQTSGHCAELEEKLIETRKTAEEEKHTLQQSLETSASVKEGQLKQQLKDLKTRLKQVLQESETLRKSNVSFANRENEMNSQLKELEAQLVLQRHECDNLRGRITQLTEQVETVPVEPQVTVESQTLVMSSTKPTAHNDSVAEFRENLQHATEMLKAEHAAHIQEMQCDLNQQLRAREEELRAEFQKTLDLARATETELRQSHQSEVDAMQLRLNELVNQNHSLQTNLDRLQAEFMTLEQESKLRSLEVPAPQSADRNDELELLRTQVSELQTQLSQLKQSASTDPSYQRTSSPSQTSRTNDPRSNSTRGTEYLSSAEYDPLDPVHLAKPSDWVEQLRSEILRADSIDSIHPAVRTNHFVHTVSAQDYEALQLHNADLQNQLHQLAADFEALRAQCSSCNGSVEHSSLTIHPYSPVLSPSVGGSHEPVEYEYLRNVLFEYMTGRETATLAKVLCSILRFNAEQTKRVLQYEDDKSRSWFIQTKIE